jgi:hypothetical protein
MYPNQYCHQCNEPEPCVELPAPPDCTGEPCEEIVLDTCVRYTGPAIPCLGITTGANLNQVLQIIANRLCDCCDGTPPVVNCVVSDWGAWSTCVNGTQTRTRTVVQQPQNGGTACPPLTESRECCNPVNCVVSEWGPWSACVNNLKTRTRTVLTPASCGGTPCPVLSETVDCVAPTCQPITNILGRSLTCETIEVSFSDGGSADALSASLALASNPTVSLQNYTWTPTGSASSYTHTFSGVTAGTYIIKVFKHDVNGDCDTVTTLSVVVAACPTNCPPPEWAFQETTCDSFTVNVAHNPSQPNVTMEYQVAGSGTWTIGGMLTTSVSGPNTISQTLLPETTTFNVRIKTKCSGGDSVWVTNATTTLACPTSCPAPTNLDYVEVCSHTENGITATASVAGATALTLTFELYDVTGGNLLVDTQVANVPGGGSGSVDFFGLGLTTGNTYEIRVVTNCESFTTSSQEVLQFVKAACKPAELPCPAPTNLTATIA